MGLGETEEILSSEVESMVGWEQRDLPLHYATKLCINGSQTYAKGLVTSQRISAD
jgi:hypothetical protein